MPDPVTMEAFQALGRLFHVHRQAMQRCLGNAERHHGDVMSLRLLARNDGISQSELANVLHLSRPRVTSILQRLEKEGAVRREPDPADQRVSRVFLTPKGRAQEQENRAAFERYVNSTIGAVSKADRQELTRILDEISRRIDAVVCAVQSENEGRVAS